MEQMMNLRDLIWAGCFDINEEQKEREKADAYNASIGERDKIDGYDCPICRNKGNIMVPFVDDYGRWNHKMRECRCQKIRSSILRMKASGLEDVIRRCTFDRYNAAEDWQVEIKQAAMEYAGDPDGWFFIGGQTGAGKSHICTAICRDLLYNSGMGVRYMVWKDESVKLKAVVTDSTEYTKAIDVFKTADVLYIDDFFWTGDTRGRWKPTAGDLNLGFEIINYRYLHPQKPTIISSQHTLPDLIRADEAIGGRIKELAGTNSFSIDADRKKNQRIGGKRA